MEIERKSGRRKKECKEKKRMEGGLNWEKDEERMEGPRKQV